MQTQPLPIVTDELTQAQYQIREKLHEMRKMFDDEDEIQPKQ